MPRCLKLEEEVRENQLDEAQVQFLLPMLRTEWLHAVRAINMRARQAHWLPLTVDITTGGIENLPESWIARLQPVILERARAWAKTASPGLISLSVPVRPSRSPSELGGDEDLDAPGLRQDAWPVKIDMPDLLWGEHDHSSYLHDIFRGAKTSIFIASAFLGINRLEALRDDLVDALGRGVTIDLLWGYNAGQGIEMNGVDWLKKLNFDTRREGAKGTLRFNSVSSDSHAKLVLWDSNDGWEACVGSFNWLSAQPTAVDSEPEGSIERHFTDLSLRIRASNVIAPLIRSAVALWLSAPFGRLQSTADRWHRIASQLERDALEFRSTATVDSNAVIRIVLDFHHEAQLRLWLANARNRLVVASHKLGIAAETRLPGRRTDQKRGL